MTKPWFLDGQVDVCDISDFRPILVHLSGGEADTLMPRLNANSDSELVNICGMNPGDSQNLALVFNVWDPTESQSFFSGYALCSPALLAG